jgi:hypothetical protein
MRPRGPRAYHPRGGSASHRRFARSAADALLAPRSAMPIPEGIGARGKLADGSSSPDPAGAGRSRRAPGGAHGDAGAGAHGESRSGAAAGRGRISLAVPPGLSPTARRAADTRPPAESVHPRGGAAFRAADAPDPRRPRPLARHLRLRYRGPSGSAVGRLLRLLRLAADPDVRRAAGMTTQARGRIGRIAAGRQAEPVLSVQGGRPERSQFGLCGVGPANGQYRSYPKQCPKEG